MKTHMLKKLNDICLFVQNFEESVLFYTEKMRFEIIRRQPGYVEFDFVGTSVTLWNEEGVYAAIGKEELGGPGHHFMLAVRVPQLEDVDDIISDLESRGVKIISRPRTYAWGSRAAYFKDNSENIWEVFAWEEGPGPGLLKEKREKV